MEENEIRTQFEKKITPIIQIESGKLCNFFERKCPGIKHCNLCKKRLSIKERGLTKENISIYLKFIQLWNKDQFIYCIGKDDKGFVLCYGIEMVPLITRINKEVFSQISNIAYTLKKCENDKLDYDKLIKDTDEETKKLWNHIEQGVLALNSSYQRTKFGYSKDILLFTQSDRVVVCLHGHQLNDFLDGKRLEQKEPKKFPEESIDVIEIAHFHRLGIISFDGFDGLVFLIGCFVYPKSFYFPEMLSHIGGIIPNFTKFSFDINRMKIDVNKMKETIRKNEETHFSFNQKVKIFREDICKKYAYLLPGNHDVFDEVYIKTNEKSKSKLIGFGDYVDFSSEEMEKARKIILKILKQENFEPISKLKTS